jgi:hypothetical protein
MGPRRSRIPATGERHEALGVESDFSIFNGNESFRPNGGARAGKLNALLFGGLQSVSAEGVSRNIAGVQILKR